MVSGLYIPTEGCCARHLYSGMSSHQCLVSRSSPGVIYRCLILGSGPLAAPFALAVLGHGLSGLLREAARVGQDRGHLDDLEE